MTHAKSTCSTKPSFRPAAAAIATLLAIGALVALPRAAAGHALDPSLLELREEAGGLVMARFKTPALVPAGLPELRPVFPEECRTVGTPSSSHVGKALVVTWTMSCGEDGLVGARIGIEGLAARTTDALVHVELADGRTVRDLLNGRRPSFEVPAEEHTAGVAGRYLVLGVEHILLGPDHLLFVLGLLLLVSGRRRLLATVTAFTAGHSVTLSLAVLGVMALPPGPVEIAIAASILVLAVELARPAAERTSSAMGRRPWLLAGLFGLLHGLGFAGALAEVGLPASDVPLALATFNAGIEIGQLLFLAAVLVALRALRTLRADFPRWVELAPTYAIGTLAAFWIFERTALLF
jgi:hydrogenase/urease accessory protein HupE